jgi:hypothetical protein
MGILRIKHVVSEQERKGEKGEKGKREKEGKSFQRMCPSRPRVLRRKIHYFSVREGTPAHAEVGNLMHVCVECVRRKGVCEGKREGGEERVDCSVL